ncbi:MAG: cysteine synthase family protein, partial [Nitrososphaerota archaeon]
RKEVVDDWIVVNDKDAFRCVRMAAEKENLLIGPSSGAVLHAALQLAEKGVEGNIVVIFADDGRKFSSVYEEFGVFNREEFKAILSKARYLPKNFVYE